MIKSHCAAPVEDGVQLCQHCGAVLAEALFEGGIVVPGPTGIPRRGFYPPGEVVLLDELGGIVDEPWDAPPCKPPAPAVSRKKKGADPTKPDFMPTPKGPGA